MLLLLSKARLGKASCFLKLVIEKRTTSLLIYPQGVRAASWPQAARSSASAPTSVAASDCLVSSMGYLVTKPLLVRETRQRNPLVSSFQNQMHPPTPKKGPILHDCRDDHERVCAGVVSCDNQFPATSGRQSEYLSSGPMCRYATDLKPMLRIMAGPRADM